MIIQVITRGEDAERFLTNDGTWADHQTNARAFKSCVEALEACIATNLKLEEIEILYAFDNPHHNFTVPLTDRKAQPSASLWQWLVYLWLSGSSWIAVSSEEAVVDMLLV